MKLSIIIPVYNVAPYVRKCVESVLNQDLDPQDYEVILVDDGSTDGSGAICEDLAQSTIHNPQSTIATPVAHVIHQPNAGLSMARNAGIAVAKGKYIQFVDSDDYLEPNVLGGLVAQMERENLDVLRFDYQNVRINPQNGEYEVFEPYKTPRQVDQCTEIVSGETYLNTRMGYACYAVQFMIRRSLLTDCVFTPGIWFEDTEWTPRMLLLAMRVNSTRVIAYNYLLRKGSISQGGDAQKREKIAENLLMVNQSLKKLMGSCKDTRWLRGCISDNVYGILSSAAVYDCEKFTDWLSRIEQSGDFPLFAYKRQFRVRIKYALINYMPHFYSFIIHELHKKNI